MPPLPKPAIELACMTDPGQVRSQNEDSVAGDAEIGFAVLADGMGGHNAGEVASRIAADLVSARFRSDASLHAYLDARRAESFVATTIAAANSAVLEASATHPRYRGMGTTLVLVFWHDKGVTYGHVGDSRLYLLREGRLERLTRDHTVVQEQLEQGSISAEQARHAPNRNVLTRAIGIDAEVEADVRTIAIRRGDLYLLCSDGLTDMMTDDEIGSTLLACEADPTIAAERLIELANEAGGHDNVSVALARVLSVSSPLDG
jgi:serine/threonine protein phosphatase PrpC